MQQIFLPVMLLLNFVDFKGVHKSTFAFHHQILEESRLKFSDDKHSLADWPSLYPQLLKSIPNIVMLTDQWPVQWPCPPFIIALSESLCQKPFPFLNFNFALKDHSEHMSLTGANASVQSPHIWPNLIFASTDKFSLIPARLTIS